jgi:hypothetical protein
MMRARAFVLGAALLLLAGCDAGDGRQTYTSKEKGFSLKLPKEWVVAPIFRSANSTTFNFHRDRNDPDRALISVTVMEPLQPGTTARDILDQYRSALPDSFKQKARARAPYDVAPASKVWEETGAGTLQIGGQDAEWFEFHVQAVVARLEFGGVVHSLVKDGRGYVIIANTTGRLSNSPERTALDAVVRSFQAK